MRIGILLCSIFGMVWWCLGSNVNVCDIDANGNSNCEQTPKGANPEGLPPTVSLEMCHDRHAECVDYEAQGECEANPGWMIVNCPHSCKACHLRDPKVRCARSALNISLEPAYRPEEMNDMFSSIVDTFGDRYGVTVVSTDPWVVTFDNFVTDVEIDALLETVEGNWERSTDTGSMNEFGETGRVLSTGRTSSNAWCRRECSTHPDVLSIMHKIEEVIRIPKTNYESFQVLRYDRGQQYMAHHDMGPRQVKLSCGPRILTFFLYLSDVEEGGETYFPTLNIKVKPSKGKALLWPSTLNDDPEQMDTRTTHAALPVVKGRKLAANAWVHLYDFEKSNLWGCTGTFDML